MTKQAVETSRAPGAIGPYSQAIKTSGFIFVSGQIAINPATGDLISGSVADEARQVLTNLRNVVEAAGATMNDVVKTTIFLRDMQDFQAVNEVYASFFARPYPARATVAVAGLPKNVRVEVECIAKVGG